MGSLFEVLLFVVVLISTCTANVQVFYVLPDNSTNASCPFQPCATLNQYLLDNNGSLPVVSNVEYRFLAGEHRISTNTKLQHLLNFAVVGLSVKSTILLANLQASIEISYSINVTITKLVFKTSQYHKEYRNSTCNVMLSDCFSCRIFYIYFIGCSLCGKNLVGKAYLSNMVMDFTMYCYIGIYLYYDEQTDHCNESTVVINRVVMRGQRYCDPGTILPFHNSALHILLPDKAVSNVTLTISNSEFYSMGQPLIFIDGTTNNMILVKTCKFENNMLDKHIYEDLERNALVHIRLSPFNTALILLNWRFHWNQVETGTVVFIKVHQFEIPDSTSFVFSSNVTIKRLKYDDNKGILIHLHSSNLTLLRNYVFIEHMYMYWNNNYRNHALISIKNMNVYFIGRLNILVNEGVTIMSAQLSHISYNARVTISNSKAYNIMMFQSSTVLFNGPMIIANNKASIMHMHSCDVTFNGSINIHDNKGQMCHHIMEFQFCNIVFSATTFITSNVCEQIIILKSYKKSAYIKMMEFTNITFFQNIYSSLISIETDTNYNNPYPFCLFQYMSLQNTSTILPSHYTIIISDSFVYKCKLTIYQFTSHCQWIPTAVFNGHNPVIVNEHIIQVDYKYQHTVIFHCSNYSSNSLGPIYPGQTLQVELCMPCGDNNSVLYAETHNTLLPESTCKIAHQRELVNFITNNSEILNYTIVSEISDSCELFLTVTPFLYYIYEVFDVQLLPCPIGFTLQNGVCDCDPLLPTDIDTCYIDQSAIRRPANTWISYTQSGTSKYLISDCPMDYCLPISSNVNLLNPDTQCQFSRTGILCSQCKHPLSMVFGSSRCMKCTNVHILITLIVIVAGIVLVVLLYLLNLTVTKATINGIILYANIISINNSVFLQNENIFAVLKVFISFTNLDLGIETCFYHGMDSYIKMWLQLFFPLYLITIAFSVIMASRYSSRILRLTYSRSLPVLATLFLLSYTSVLRTVLTVLFSYSTITHVPGGHQKLVWSIDASVPLFGVKFTILFITCLILFLILMFFDMILLFMRCLVRFRLINRFKPILDAFQGSYKDRYYYWVAVHVILKSLFFALYAFPVKLRLLLATMILVPFSCISGYLCPNKNRMINFQELILLINLTITHAASCYGSDSAFSIVTNLMINLAFLQFCIIVIYHFLTYTCHCSVENKLQIVKEIIVNYMCKRKDDYSVNIELLNVPERAYNYNEYQDGLVSEDFSVDRDT